MERERIRALASRWAEIAALPVMAERKRGWRALHDLRRERPMVLFEVGSVDQYVGEDELRCTNPVLRAAEATMLEHIRHFDEVGDDIVLEPYYRLGWDITDTGWGVEVIQIPGPAAADGLSIGYTFNFPIKTPADVELLRPREFSVDRGAGVESMVAVYVPTNHLYLGDVWVFPRAAVSFPDLSVEEGVRVFLTGGTSMPPTVRASGEPSGRP